MSRSKNNLTHLLDRCHAFKTVRLIAHFKTYWGIIMENWTRLPLWLRLTVSLSLMAGAIIIPLILAILTDRLFWGLGGMMFIFGCILLAMGPSDSEDNGYNF